MNTVKAYARRGVNPLKSLDVQRGKPMRNLTKRETIIPIAVVSISLFMMWGLAYGLLDIMNFHIRVAKNLKREHAAYLAAGYYFAYIPGTLFIGGPLVKQQGYRVAMVTGLFMLAIGDFFMSLAGSRTNFPGMVAAHFVVGLGVSTLERSANAYAVNCGPRDGANLRILIAQAFAGIGTVIAPFLANAFVFDPNSSGQAPDRNPFRPGRCVERGVGPIELTPVVTFYCGLGGCIIGLTFLMAVLCFRTNWIPEVPQQKSPKTTSGWKVWNHPLCSMRYSRLYWGLVANFFNLGCQVTFAQYFMEHMKINACASNKWAANWMSVAQTAFVLGRFAAAALVSLNIRGFSLKPRWVLLVYITGAVALTGASTSAYGGTAIALAVMVMFWESASFPMIFESATAGYGEWTPTCETLTIMSISGGGVQPLLMGKLVDHVGISTGWWLTTAFFGVVLTYPLALNLVPSYGVQVDSAESQEDGVQDVEFATKTPSSQTVGEVQDEQVVVDESKTYFGGKH